MYSLTVRDHLMIAHSFTGELFGPAQQLHGATYVVDATFFRPELDDHDLVIDIGLAGEQLKAVLAGYNMKNLDEVASLAGINTTTERMAQVIFADLKEAIAAGRLGESAHGITRLRLTLSESHIAWATYEDDL